MYVYDIFVYHSTLASRIRRTKCVCLPYLDNSRLRTTSVLFTAAETDGQRHTTSQCPNVFPTRQGSSKIIIIYTKRAYAYVTLRSKYRYRSGGVGPVAARTVRVHATLDLADSVILITNICFSRAKRRGGCTFSIIAAAAAADNAVRAIGFER